jgi:hypothetical protein
MARINRQLGNGLRITGNLADSQATARYGISKDPEYPLLYYHLACVAAEEGRTADTKTFLN